ncbi:E3 SUMO-protein ligase ZBED1-like [Armigeres subalbatus]|uniref:E3 SUMO-protein ligase ZBED1-like n=1 Tax=Armigeres subalbatus TaxID=124917 RepID=UPI002ED11396
MNKHCPEIFVSIESSGDILEADEQYPILFQEEYDDPPDHVGEVYHGPPKPSPTLKTYTVTRWHALLNMLRSLGLNRCGINTILGRIDKPELILTSCEWKLVEDLIIFLQPFETIVTSLSSEKHATINVALLLRSEIEACIRASDDDSLAIVQMKESMNEQFERRFPISDIMLASALLDPRFVNLKSITEILMKKSLSKSDFLARMVLKELKDNGVELSNAIVTPEAIQPSSTTSICALAIKHSHEHEFTDSVIEQECQTYISSVNVSQVKNDVVKFWSDRQKQFPWLSTLASKYLCVPATSTPSERVFNVAGLTVSARRSSIHPANVNKTIFVHDNYEMCRASLGN